MKIRICRNCEFYFTALFGDSYCMNEESPNYEVILDFKLTKPPMRKRVWRCKYFVLKKVKLIVDSFNINFNKSTNGK